ncbi:acyltransferase [Vibrio hippocampi]|uniref:2,3,4,5-tetrahydropyridine-2,6-dicarboxylate N-acetyltransferase n=1 Tax=Vibrio hippocampi TaxID=654686 RepID=A0ABN8DN73_9VIBR|nr:acyltransferase [Vibrio hippocampi]CAH0529968.1 2,3,4,5-tetrahydropyridine-2,6-dicarboxylate N-acetyltransferase [Vibrio hippocampi]
MNADSMQRFKCWLKQHPDPKMQKLFIGLKRLRASSLPTPKLVNQVIYASYTFGRDSLSTLQRLFVATPAFKGRCQQCGDALYLYGGLPYISGPLNITVGDECRISGMTTFNGRSTLVNTTRPELLIGNNVGIGWQVTISVATQVVIEDNVRIAAGCQLFGYSGHPIDARDRAAGMPDEENRVGSIVLQHDVWLGSGVRVLPGVTVGAGTIVAAGSIVTHDLPPYCLAAGAPVKVIRSLETLGLDANRRDANTRGAYA